MRVHHGNLTSLVGYCNEGENNALIYEFMANGDLDSHLSGLLLLYIQLDFHVLQRFCTKTPYLGKKEKEKIN